MHSKSISITCEAGILTRVLQQTFRGSYIILEDGVAHLEGGIMPSKGVVIPHEGNKLSRGHQYIFIGWHCARRVA